MRQKRYIIFAITLILLIPLVIATFANISERRVAALIAGTMFLFLPISQMWSLYKATRNFQPKVWWIVYLQFLILFAGPIYYLRIAHYDSDFASLSLLGVSSTVLHQFSSYSLSLLILANLFYFFKK